MNKQRWRGFAERNAILGILILVYLIIGVLSYDKPYFWDNVQQTSKEAHWFYENGFSSLILPGFSDNSEIVSTGYHPPLMGMMTASLWLVFGKHLWVSRLFVLIWAILLIVFVNRLAKRFLPEPVLQGALPVILLESTLLTQIYIASPDLILLTSLVMALLAVVDDKKALLTVSMIFLVLINGRGMLTGVLLFMVYLCYHFVCRKEVLVPGQIIKRAIPFFPAFALLLGYYFLYFRENGWFFSNADSPWSGEWQAPDGWREMLKNIVVFGLRLVENGRVIIWLLVLWVFKDRVTKETLKDFWKSPAFPLALLTAMLFGLFFYFAVTTKMVIGSRYYMGLILLLTLLLFRGMSQRFSLHRIRQLSFVMVLFSVTGHFWIYPDKIAKAWDATLAHVPYYELREECMDYLETHHYDCSKISGGFGFAGNQRYVDLQDRGIVYSNDSESPCFIYSNISNLSDEFLTTLENPLQWQAIKSFKKGAVVVTLYRNLNHHD